MVREHHIRWIARGTKHGSAGWIALRNRPRPAELRALASSNAFQDVFTLQVPYVDASFRRKQDRRQTPSVLTVGLKHKVALRDSLLRSRRGRVFDHAPANYNDAKWTLTRWRFPSAVWPLT